MKTLAKSIVGSETDEYKIAKLFAEYTSKNSLPGWVCDHYAVFFRMLCSSYNIPCVYIGGGCYEENRYGGYNGDAHAWNAFYANGKWHYVDCMWLSVGSQYWDMTADFMAQRRMAQCIEWGKTITYNSSSWSKDTIDLAIKNNLLNYAFFNSHTHKNSTDSLSSSISYLQNRCNRESFAVLAINLLEEYYGIEHYESKNDDYGQYSIDPDDFDDSCLTNDGIDALLKLKGMSMPSASTFSDTDSRYVRAAYALGIISGYGNGKYGPTDDLTREQAAKILTNTASIMGIEVSEADASASLQGFTDAGEISRWAQTSVGAVKHLGVMNGTSATTFSPKESYTAEQCIVTIERLYEYATK
jgi:hypothetical protein